MIDPIVFNLPWPPSALSPNGRLHWSKLAKAKKSYRAACANTAISQGGRKLTADALAVRVTFVPPDRRARDTDNMIASVKAGLDGLADVLGVDDSKWQLTISRTDEVGGMVKVEVRHA